MAPENRARELLLSAAHLAGRTLARSYSVAITLGYVSALATVIGWFLGASSDPSELRLARRMVEANRRFGDCASAAVLPNNKVDGVRMPAVPARPLPLEDEVRIGTGWPSVSEPYDADHFTSVRDRS